MREDGSYLGNMAEGSIMQVNGSDTVYARLGHSFTAGAWTVEADINLGLTKVNLDDNALVNDADLLVSDSAAIKMTRQFGEASLGLVAGLPVAIRSGDTHYRAASSVNQDGSLNYASGSIDMSAQDREMNFGIFGAMPLSGNAEISGFAEVRDNFKGIADERDVSAGLKFQLRF